MRLRLPAAALLLWMQASTVFAQTLKYNNQTKQLTLRGTAANPYYFWTIMSRIIDYLAGAIAAVAITMFVVGALLVTLSGVKEDLRQKGKDLMIGSVISLAVVLGAYALLRMIEYFLTT